MPIEIYTDGSCVGNPGIGGYAALILYGKNKKEISGGFSLTTNNRMEMKAVIEALKVIKSGQHKEVKIFSDSKYIIDTFKHDRLIKWQQNGWKSSSKATIKNLDLWKDLLELTKKFQIEWNWVAGHSGNTHNEHVDKLAKSSTTKTDLPKDSGYLKPVKIVHTEIQQMIDISKKKSTQRIASAVANMHLKSDVLTKIEKDQIAKGNVYETARTAGIMAVKNTPSSIPLCHNIEISSANIHFVPDTKSGTLNIKSEVKALSKTGVEMEALHAVSIAALTVYDMCKSYQKDIAFEVTLTEKSGGTSGNYSYPK